MKYSGRKYSKEELLEMYEALAEARSFNIQMNEAVNKGYCRVAFHDSWGEEAYQIGMYFALKDNCWYSASHRSQNILMNLMGKEPLIAEVLCRRTGKRKGTAFDAHISDFENKVMVQCALIGSATPIAAGFAWGLKQQGKDEVVVLDVGDGASSEGCSYEAWNLAKLHECPVVFCIANNEWAMTVHQTDETPNPNISEKMIPCGIQSTIVDGNDILAVREAVEDAIKLAEQNIPNAVECKMLRWHKHLIGHRDFERPDKDKLEWAFKHDDPLKRYEHYLIDEGVADEAYFEEVKARKEKEIYDIIEKCGNEEFASFEEIFNKDFIYANPETGGDL